MLLLLDDQLLFEFLTLRHFGSVHPILEAPLHVVESVSTPMIDILFDKSLLLSQNIGTVPPFFKSVRQLPCRVACNIETELHAGSPLYLSIQFFLCLG